MKGILGYTEDDVVSTDFVGDNRYKKYCLQSDIQFSDLINGESK